MSVFHKAALSVAAAGFISKSKRRGGDGSQSLSITPLRRGPLTPWPFSIGWGESQAYPHSRGRDHTGCDHQQRKFINQLEAHTEGRSRDGRAAAAYCSSSGQDGSSMEQSGSGKWPD